MNVLDFVASVVRSVAWPAVIVFAVLLLRKQLTELLASLSEFSFSKEGLRGRFDRKLRETSMDVDEVKVESAAELPPESRRLLDEKEHITGNSARIAAAWQVIEEALRRRLKNLGVESATLGASALVQVAFDHNLITDMERRSLSGLNTMRNLAIHGQTREIDDKRTQEFLVLADAMKTVLDITAD